jgi:glycosyltransferase involved in cell wall biosynthesis
MFSIVVPVYNKRALLRATVESALAQSFAEFELILVDDGSTDGSLEAVADIADPRICILRQPNGGASAARNAGMAAARHEWIAFLDADDLWLPDHLAELDRIRSRFPEAGLIGTAFVRGTAAALPAGGGGDIRAITYFEEVGRGRVPFWTSSAAVRADAALAVGGFNDDPIGQDSEYWARVAFDYPVAASTRATAIYRLATGGIIDRARYRWRGREIRSAGDISSAAALVSARYEQVESPELRRSLDLYLDRFVRWCLEHSVEIGDVPTVRSLRPVYRTAPTRAEAWLMRVARLPKAAARAAFRAYLFAVRVKRRLSGR